MYAEFDGVQVFLIGLVGFMLGVAAFCVVGLAFNLQPSPNLKQCAETHNVYQCGLVAVPVTPDGQPLDMSDPFHGEDE